AAATTASIGSLRDGITVRHVLLSRLAAGFADTLAPWHTANIATRVGVLRSHGIETAAALGSVGLAVVTRIVTQLATLYLAVRISGRDGSIDVVADADVGWVVAAGAGVVVGALTALLPGPRRSITRAVTPALRAWIAGLRSLTGRPVRLAQLLVGSLFVPLAMVGAMVAADRAVGGTLDPPSLALVTLGVAFLAAFLP